MAESTSDRSSKIGHDVSDSVIISGDSNHITYSETQIIQALVEEVKTRPFIAASPYKGLKKFEQTDKERFFGREQFVRQLVNDLSQTNFLLLLGASGSGKSSVVRAGLIPRLAQQWGDRFVNLTFNPDHDPFESLYASLSNRYRQAETRFVRQGKSEALVQMVETLKSTDDYWLIFIDQFEELFTISQIEKRNQFIAGLVWLDRWLKKFPVQDCRIKVMAAMRSDFLDRLSPYPKLVKATDRARPMIADLQPDELRLVIEQPAVHHGVSFEDGLVEEIIKNVEGQAGHLPLLQYTLNLLWEKEVETGSIRDRTLNITTYRELGGVRGALQKHVDHIYRALSPGDQLAARRIFLKLVDIGKSAASETDWKPVRQRALRSRFSDASEQRVLTQLIDANLLVSDRPLQATESTVEVAHEVLLTAWTTLEAWIRENRQAITLRNRLEEDVSRWREKKSEDELWSGSKLAQALELSQDETFNQVLGGFGEQAQAFLRASQQVLRNHRLRTLAWGIAGVGIVAGFGAFLWFKDVQEQPKREILNLAADAPAKLELLPTASNLLTEAQELAKRGEVDEALRYYRQVIGYTLSLRQQDKQIPQNQHLAPDCHTKQQAQIEQVFCQAETDLAALIKDKRLPALKAALEAKPPLIGRKKREFGGGENQSDERFEPGALKLTFDILRLKSGAGADVDYNGKINTSKEADRMPCKTLEDIEKLWRQHTNQLCGWYSRSDKDTYIDPGCEGLGGATLTEQVFNVPYDAAISRINQCGFLPVKLEL